MRLTNVVAVAIALVVGCGPPIPATTSSPTFASNVPCGAAERFERHAHAHLTVVVRGEMRTVPKNIGITATFICWLHTHDDSGIIHIEAGDARAFTLGDFFDVWQRQLSDTALVSDRVGRGETIRATKNQAEVTGSPRSIVLEDHDDLVLLLGPPYPTVASYVWPAGF
jgi:hypothetical protein